MKKVVLREAVGQSGLQVQEGGNRISGVKVLGFDSQNRRRYTLESAQQALPMYEGVAVNVDHPSDNPNATRAVRDRFGWLENCSVEQDGIRGDLVYNPAHPLAEAVAWWAKNQPSKLGLSHNAVGQGETRDGVFVVEKIMSVRGVDLVTEPASTKGLFEGRTVKTKQTTEQDDETANLDGGAVADVPVDTGTEEVTGENDWKDHLLDGIKKVLASTTLDTAQQLSLAQAILRVIKSGHNGNGSEDAGLGAEEPEETEEAEDEPEEESDDDYDDDEEKPGGKMEGKKKKPTADTATVKSLREELDRLRAKEAVRDRTEQAVRLCKKAGLPKPAITQVFLEQLANCDDDTQMRRLIEDRKRTCGIQRPRSVGGGTRTMEAKEFANIVKGRGK